MLFGRKSGKYKVKSDMFFLYPSNYVPSMAIVEGKLFTPDIERMVLFLESIPPETKFVFMWYHYFIGIFIVIAVFYFIRKRNRQRR